MTTLDRSPFDEGSNLGAAGPPPTPITPGDEPETESHIQLSEGVVWKGTWEELGRLRRAMRATCSDELSGVSISDEMCGKLTVHCSVCPILKDQVALDRLLAGYRYLYGAVWGPREMTREGGVDLPDVDYDDRS